MKNYAVIGSSWGDEGKGKIVDFLTQKADIIIRYQGGNNAGHTIEFDDKRYILHFLPSGILSPKKICVIGNGMVLDLKALAEEIDALQQQKVKLAKLIISNKVTLIMPWHKIIDSINGKKIGTTGKGIGPAYISKIARNGFKAGELLDFNKFKVKLKHELIEVNWFLKNKYQHEELIEEDIIHNFENYANRFKSMIISITNYLHNHQNKTLLFEGAQGVLLDIDHGTYPYVTSSNPSFGGIFTGSGIRVRDLEVTGIVKAYATRVGNGPFPTELDNDKLLREKGKEFGATTGRPRRCGWLDLVLLKYSTFVNGFDNFALTKLDILSGFKELKVAVAYKKSNEFPDILNLENVEPIFKTLPGWDEDISKCKSFEELPENCKAYVKFIEDYTNTPIKYIGIGPKRKEIIIR